MSISKHLPALDMMTGHAEVAADQLPAATRDPSLRAIACVLAGAAVVLSIGGGLGVPAPRVGISSARQEANIPEKKT